MTISDDGVGLTDGGAKRSGLGLITMRERAETLGGKYSVSGNAGKGCTITLNWPKAALESM
jgi:signal transduction histidine kinase